MWVALKRPRYSWPRMPEPPSGFLRSCAFEASDWPQRLLRRGAPRTASVLESTPEKRGSKVLPAASLAARWSMPTAQTPRLMSNRSRKCRRHQPESARNHPGSGRNKPKLGRRYPTLGLKPTHTRPKSGQVWTRSTPGRHRRKARVGRNQPVAETGCVQTAPSWVDTDTESAETTPHEG